jgi:hypothetical protein
MCICACVFVRSLIKTGAISQPTSSTVNVHESDAPMSEFFPSVTVTVLRRSLPPRVAMTGIVIFMVLPAEMGPAIVHSPSVVPQPAHKTMRMALARVNSCTEQAIILIGIAMIIIMCMSVPKARKDIRLLASGWHEESDSRAIHQLDVSSPCGNAHFHGRTSACCGGTSYIVLGSLCPIAKGQSVTGQQVHNLDTVGQVAGSFDCHRELELRVDGLRSTWANLVHREWHLEVQWCGVRLSS